MSAEGGMSTLAIEIKILAAESVSVTDDTMSVNLSDGRTILVPTAWYPHCAACYAERKKKMEAD